MKIYAGGGRTKTIQARDLAGLSVLGKQIDDERKRLNASYNEIKGVIAKAFGPTERKRTLPNGTVIKLTGPTRPVVDGEALHERFANLVREGVLDRALARAAVQKVTVYPVDSAELRKLRELGIAEVNAAIEACTERVDASRTLTFELPEHLAAKAAA